jgi:hypothetical protein
VSKNNNNDSHEKDEVKTYHNQYIDKYLNLELRSHRYIQIHKEDGGEVTYTLPKENKSQVVNFPRKNPYQIKSFSRSFFWS